MSTLRDTLDVSDGGQIAVGAHGSVSVTSPGQLLVDGLQVVGGQAANVAAIGTPTGDEVTINAIIEALQTAKLMAQSAPAGLAFVQVPTDVPTGDVITPPVTVQILDDFGNPLADNATDVTVALTTPGGATLGGTLTQTAINGIATFDDLTVDTADTGYSLDASSGALGPVTSDTFDVVAPAATSLAFGVQPTGAHTGDTIAPSVTVEVLDQDGQLLASDSSTSVVIALTTAGGATLGGTLTRVASAGVATFNNLTVDTVGLYTLHATASGVTAATSDAFQIGAR
jgi:hypothetical protein